MINLFEGPAAAPHGGNEMETYNYERVDRPFFFTAIGPADD